MTTVILDSREHVGWREEVDFDAAVALMDDELRERVHSEIAPCSEQEFIDMYAQLHVEKYGERFVVD